MREVHEADNSVASVDGSREVGNSVARVVGGLAGRVDGEMIERE